MEEQVVLIFIIAVVALFIFQSGTFNFVSWDKQNEDLKLSEEEIKYKEQFKKIVTIDAKRDLIKLICFNDWKTVEENGIKISKEDKEFLYFLKKNTKEIILADQEFIMTNEQNKAFANMRKSGQVVEATQGVEDFQK
jgi:hypothetical protein